VFELHGILQDHQQLQPYVDACPEHTAVLLNTTVLRSQAASRSLTNVTVDVKKKQYEVLMNKSVLYILLI
jgi:hypothetical protein